MIKIVLIEDEYPAAERLAKMIRELGELEIVAVLESVETSVKFFKNNTHIDLIFSDVQLSDGLSFEIFEQVSPQSPIIFTTSYDEYAIKAFKVKSIDYLLKPVKMQELEQAYQKFLDFKKSFSPDAYNLQLEKLLNQLNPKPKNYKQRFLVKYQEQIIPVSQEQIAYFYATNKMVCMVLKENKQFLMDYTLEELEHLLNPALFFRLNRQFIVSAEAIQKIHTYFNGKLKIELNPTPLEEVLVSRDKNVLFQEWLEGKEEV
jgi:DNA-binding LytR/AlgR family response regulator